MEDQAEGGEHTKWTTEVVKRQRRNRRRGRAQTPNRDPNNAARATEQHRQKHATAAPAPQSRKRRARVPDKRQRCDARNAVRRPNLQSAGRRRANATTVRAAPPTSPATRRRGPSRPKATATREGPAHVASESAGRRWRMAIRPQTRKWAATGYARTGRSGRQITATRRAGYRPEDEPLERRQARVEERPEDGLENAHGNTGEPLHMPLDRIGLTRQNCAYDARAAGTIYDPIGCSATAPGKSAERGRK